MSFEEANLAAYSREDFSCILTRGNEFSLLRFKQIIIGKQCFSYYFSFVRVNNIVR